MGTDTGHLVRTVVSGFAFGFKCWRKVSECLYNHRDSRLPLFHFGQTHNGPGSTVEVTALPYKLSHSDIM